MVRPRFYPAFVSLALSIVACSLRADVDAERGRPLIRTFTRQEHKAHAQFHAPWQSPEGLMYFGNQLAVMEYDGRAWRVLKIPLPFTRAMAAGPHGDLYVGDEEQLGVLARPDSGEPRYTSLLDRVPAEAKSFGFVRDVRLWRGDLYFSTDKNILRFREATRSFRVWPMGGDARNRLFVAGERLILHRQGEGLHECDGETWHRLSSAPELARTGNSFVVSGRDPDELIIGLDDRGLYRLRRDGALTPWPTEGDAVLHRSPILTAARLRDHALAIGTVSEGVIILDDSGHLLRHITRESGLPQATVFALCEDREGALWVGTNNAPARILWRSAATVFDHQTSGITDARATDLERHEGVLYYLSNDGLFRLAPSTTPDRPAHFERDPRVDVQTRLSGLLSHRAGLLLAGGRGLQRLGANGLELLSARRDGLLGLSASKTDPSRVYFAHARGIGTGRFDAGGQWHDEDDIPGIEADCYDVFEDANGTLWAGTTSKGVFAARRAPGASDWRTPEIAHYGTSAGLPEGHGSIYLWDTTLGILFDTARGIYRFDRAAGRFVFYRELTAFDARPLVLNPVARGADGELWTNGLATDIKTKEAPFPLLHLRARPGGTFVAENPPPEIQDFFSPGAPYRIAWEPGASGHPGVIWAKGDQGLLRIDLAAYPTPSIDIAPLVRSIAAEGRDVVFAADGLRKLDLKYSREPLTITWVSGRFGRSESERFQTRLVGFNDAWSAPTARNDVAFTNLEGGPFRFEVRTVDRQGRAGPSTAFAFRVAPPWSRSPAAYVLYSILGFVAVTGFVRWRLRSGERERARLEQVVAERTAELRVAKEAADAASRAKSTFLANMSHELRTPLNGVIGYAQVLRKAPELSPENRARLNVVQTSGEHLLHMINEVLDLSKIEAGKMELASAPLHLPQLLAEIAAALQPRAAQKQLAFTVEVPPELPERVTGDAVKLRQVLDNLLGNAIKFTAAGSVRLTGERLEDDRVRFVVTDTGVGMSAADQAKLFEPFQQAADGRPPEPGTGLGLAISRRMVELMGGRLEVESAPGRGSRFFFTLRLPIVAPEPAAASAEAAPIVGYRGARRRVLIVDDVATNRDVLRDLLAPLGFEIAEATNGLEALAAAPAFRPDLVFLDLRMPGLDGFELTRRLHALDSARLKIIAMSASVLSFNRADAFAAGCDDFLPKPFREADLLARLGAVLQLEWDYAPTTAASPAGAKTADPTGSGLTEADLRELLAIVQRGEIATLRQRLATLRADPLTEILHGLARSYRMEEMRKLLEARVRTGRG